MKFLLTTVCSASVLAAYTNAMVDSSKSGLSQHMLLAPGPVMGVPMPTSTRGGKNASNLTATVAHGNAKLKTGKTNISNMVKTSGVRGAASSVMEDHKKIDKISKQLDEIVAALKGGNSQSTADWFGQNAGKFGPTTGLGAVAPAAGDASGSARHHMANEDPTSSSFHNVGASFAAIPNDGDAEDSSDAQDTADWWAENADKFSPSTDFGAVAPTTPSSFHNVGASMAAIPNDSPDAQDTAAWFAQNANKFGQNAKGSVMLGAPAPAADVSGVNGEVQDTSDWFGKNAGKFGQANGLLGSANPMLGTAKP